MPKFAIVISKDEYGYYKYVLVVDHVSHANSQKYGNPRAAFNAALEEANRRGAYYEQR